MRTHTSFIKPNVTLFNAAVAAALCALPLRSQAQTIYTDFAGNGVWNGNSFTFTSITVGGMDVPVTDPDANSGTNTYTANGLTTTFTGYAATNWKAPQATGYYLNGSVTNAYTSPGGATGLTNPPSGYYVEAGGGSSEIVEYDSPEALTDPTAVYHWHMSGTSYSVGGNGLPLGVAETRLDFAVVERDSVGSVYDIFDPTQLPDGKLLQFGFGQYDYNTAVEMGVPLDFLFWSSAFWQVEPNDLTSTPQDISGNVDAPNTVALDSITLYNGDGSLVTDWSLKDVATGQVLFNEDGKVADVPEPGAVALLAGLSLSGAGLLTRRKRSRRTV
jgi:hypothetical protein